MLRCDRPLISSFPSCRVEQPSLGPQLREAEPHGPAAQPHGPAESPGAAEPRRPAQPRCPATASPAPPAAGARKQVRVVLPASASCEDHGTPLCWVFMLFLSGCEPSLVVLWQSRAWVVHGRTVCKSCSGMKHVIMNKGLANLPQTSIRIICLPRN